MNGIPCSVTSSPPRLNSTTFLRAYQMGLRMVTLAAACTMHLDGELRTIASGMLADLIVVPRDPLTRLESLREVQLVVQNGGVYDPALLRRAAGLR